MEKGNAEEYRVDNLLFRRPCLNDIKDLLDVKNDDEAKLLLGGVHQQYTEEDIEKWIEFHNSKDDEVVFVVIDSTTNNVIGHAGIYKIDKRIRRAEYGILIGSKNARGKGLGTKITNFMSEYGFNQLGLHKIKALVLKENLPSYYMFKKCGYVDEGILVDENFKNGHYYDVVVMAKFEGSTDARQLARWIYYYLRQNSIVTSSEELNFYVEGFCRHYLEHKESMPEYKALMKRYKTLSLEYPCFSVYLKLCVTSFLGVVPMGERVLCFLQTIKLKVASSTSFVRK